jgi:hypothetical protein
MLQPHEEGAFCDYDAAEDITRVSTASTKKRRQVHDATRASAGRKYFSGREPVLVKPSR